ncbi:MAG TPA: hypothetical protein VF169_21030 [Albitalea sp.]|uniref:hypothetical protein n=1 Tax=Piscinibacter sp. TaxID=1903157 RepID=UPI002ED2540C
MALPSEASLRAIVEAGIAAPSAENRHFLRFEPADGMLRLISTDQPTWADQPHRRWLALVSYGAVVENMALRAGALGLVQATDWLADRARPGLIAHCRWTPSGATADPLAQAIAQRHTNRRFYARRPVAAEILQQLAAQASVVSGARLLWMDDPEHRALALSAMRIAESERFRREALHAELFGAVRFELGWQASADEGLPPGTLEVEPPMRASFAALRRWPLMRAMTRLGAHHALGLRAAWLPARLAPQLGLVMADSPDEALAAIDGGRALQRVWLAASAAGLAMQPMAAAVALARQRAAPGWVSADTQQRIVDRLNRLTGGRAGAACMLFRLGHAPAPSVVTARPPVEHFFVAENARKEVPGRIN